MKKINLFVACLGCSLLLFHGLACKDAEMPPPLSPTEEWRRSAENPILRDPIPAANYQVASDGHIFFEENGQLAMIYTGDTDGHASIKLARGRSLTDWELDRSLLFELGPSQWDRHKETAFYRQTAAGKHQIYYIGYPEEDRYQAQVFLAEADQLEGPYTQSASPVVPRGNLAGKDVYCITSPSVVAHEGLLYLTFLAWNAGPNEVTEVWALGARSTDEGHTWSDFQLIDTPIGMEGQLTRRPTGDFVAVRTGPYGAAEAIFYATAPHPFGPWTTSEQPLLTPGGAPLETHEIIAPQITIDPQSGEEYLFYTGADHQRGWWMMLAERP
ncbi:MAG: hypothetical protein AAFW73_18485 [Bacteroidota bacterium]